MATLNEHLADQERGRPGARSFAGNVLALSGGAVAAQAMLIAAAPVISRLFAPEAFGVAAVFTAVLALLLSVGCLRYEQAIPLPKSDAAAANLLGLCAVMIAGLTALVALAVALGGRRLLCALGGPELASCRWFFPAGVLLLGMVIPLRYWNTRQRQFKRLAWSRALGALMGLSAAMALGLAGSVGARDLVLAKGVALCTTLGLLAWHCARSDLGFVVRHCSLGGMRRVARRYVKFPLVSSWSSLLHVGANHCPTILLLVFFGSAAAGLYGRAYTLVMLPMALVGTCVQHVFFQRAAAHHGSGGDLSRLVEGVSRRLICVSMLPALVLALIGPDLFATVCGARWAEAGVYARILSPLLFAVGVCAPLSSLVYVLERQEVGLAVMAWLFVSRLAALAIGGALIGNARWTLALVTVTGVAGYGAFFLFLLSATGAARGRLARRAARHVAYALPTLAVGAVAKWALALPPWQVVAVVGVMSLTYWPLALRDDHVAKALLARATGNVWAAFRTARSA